MNRYIDIEKLIAEIERFKATEYGGNTLGDDVANGALNYVLEEIIPSLQQEQQTDEQVVVITESHGNANIEWDCRSLDDVMALLKSAESFVSDKQVEKLRGPGSGPDYATTEGRYSHLFKRQQEQPKVDLVAELKHHLAITPKEQLEKEWKELEHWNNIGPTVQEFLYGERPVEADLEKEIDAVWNPRFNLGWDEHSCLTMNRAGFENFARHFFKLGKNARKEE